MSSFSAFCREFRTGNVQAVFCLDDYFGRHRYGYQVGSKIYTEQEFEANYEIIKQENVTSEQA